MTALLDPSSPTPSVVRVFGDYRFHTDGDILDLVFAGEDSLWSLEEPGILRRWHLDGRQREYHFLSDLETAWKFSPDGRLLASASDAAAIWDVASAQLLVAFGQPSWVTALAFGGDSRLLATGHDDGIVRIWELGKGRLTREFAGHDRQISALAFSPDGKQVAAAAEDKTVSLWSLEAEEPLGFCQGHTDRIQALAWQPDGKRLVTAGWDGMARVWDASSQETVLLLNYHAAQLMAVAFSPDGLTLATGDTQDVVYLYDLAGGQILDCLERHNGSILALAFEGQGKRLASGGTDRVIRVVDLAEAGAASARVPPEVIDPGAFWYLGASLALHPDGTRLASTQGTVLQVWDAQSAQVLLESEEKTVLQSLAYAPDGRLIAGGCGDATIRLWDAATGKIQKTLADEDQLTPVTALAFAPDSKTLASAGTTGMEVWLWNVDSGEPCLLIPDALGGCAIESLTFHPQGRLLAIGGIDWLATGGSDGGVSLWDIGERCEVQSFDGGSKAVAFDPTGRRLASASLERSIWLWDVETGQLAKELTGHEDTVTCLAYSRDGRWLASGGDDRTVSLWDAASGALLATTTLNTQLKGLAFSPDGRFLFTGNGNMTCYQLDVQKILKE
jgi:WD40 repeat protein